MLVLDNGDAIKGIAEVVTKLDFIINGYVGTTATQLADGQLDTSEADLYLSGADGIVVTSISITNTDSAARTFTLYLKPSGGTSRAISPVSLDLGIGHSFKIDGQRTVVMDKSGNILSTATVLSHALGGSSHDADTLSNLNGKISDATLVDATTISGEIDGDISTHAGLADPHTGYRLESADHSHQTTGAQAGKLNHGAALNGLGDDDHAQYILHSLAGAANDFLIASGANTYVKKTLAETGAILEADLDHGNIQGLGGDDHTQYLLASGTRALAGSWNMGSQLITNLKLGGALTLNGQTFDAGSAWLEVNTTGAARGIKAVSTQDGPTGVVLLLEQVSTNIAVNDRPANISIYSKDGAGVRGEWASIKWKISNIGDGTEAMLLEWYLQEGGAGNLAMTLSGAGGLGVDADIGTADDPVALFDEYDDALVLKGAIQQKNHQLLVDMGVFTRKDTGSGYMMNIQPMTRLLAGGIYQNRAKIDNLEERLIKAGI